MVIEYGNLIIGDLHSPRNDPDPGTDRSETARPGTTELVDDTTISPRNLSVNDPSTSSYLLFLHAIFPPFQSPPIPR